MASTDIIFRLQLRAAIDADYEFWKELHRHTLHEYSMPVWTWDTERQEKFFRDNLMVREIQIIEIGAQTVGMLHLVDKPDESILGNLLIAPNFQARGIGSFLMIPILEKASRDKKPVTLWVFKENPARFFYQRFGFEIVDETASKYLMKCTVFRSPLTSEKF